MDIGDVATLDDSLESCGTSRWMGCIVCPNLGAGGENEMVNLLEQKGKGFVFILHYW